VASTDLPKGTEIYSFTGKIYPEPNMHTVQIDEKRHVLAIGSLFILLVLACSSFVFD
jgi:hypothetical protein